MEGKFLETRMGDVANDKTLEWCLLLFFSPNIIMLAQVLGGGVRHEGLSTPEPDAGLMPSSHQPLLGQDRGRCGRSFLTVAMATMAASALHGKLAQCVQHHVPAQLQATQ